MNADPHGTPSEQRRHRAHWLAASLRQSHPTYVPNRRCRSCRHVTKFVGYRCQKNRFTTQANAVCEDFNRAFDA